MMARCAALREAIFSLVSGPAAPWLPLRRQDPNLDHREAKACATPVDHGALQVLDVPVSTQVHGGGHCDGAVDVACAYQTLAVGRLLHYGDFPSAFECPPFWRSDGGFTAHYEPDRVQLRDRPTQDQDIKALGSRAAGLAIAFKLIEVAQDRWRAVNEPTSSPSSAPAAA